MSHDGTQEGGLLQPHDVSPPEPLPESASRCLPSVQLSRRVSVKNIIYSDSTVLHHAPTRHTSTLQRVRRTLTTISHHSITVARQIMVHYGTFGT